MIKLLPSRRPDRSSGPQPIDVYQAQNVLAQTEAAIPQLTAQLQQGEAALRVLLGMTPENLSRAFATLKPYGVVVDGARVDLTKPEDLRTLAKPTSLIDDPTS